jgi:predicted ATP-grasp superfamily ATP-dependent carboligase
MRYAKLGIKNRLPIAFVVSNEPRLIGRYPSANIIALTIARSLGRKGIPVVRLHPNKRALDLESKYCTKIVTCPEIGENPCQLKDFLIDLAKEYEAPRILFPTVDDCVDFIASYPELREYYEVPLPESNVIRNIINKEIQYKTAVKNGITIPETYFPKSIAEINDIAEKLDYPCVMKPLFSHEWKKESITKAIGSLKALTIKNADELVSGYKKIEPINKNIMIQEIIGGKDDRLITFLSYINKDYEMVAYCVRKKIRQNPVDFGYCSLTESVENPTIVEYGIRLLKAFGYRGISGVEFKQDPNTNEYKLIEINPRAVNTTGLAIASGVDLPFIAYQDLRGVNVPKVTTYKVGIKWIYGVLDISSAVELIRRGDLTISGWIKSLKGIRGFAFFALDDLRPFIRMVFLNLRKKINNYLGR